MNYRLFTFALVISVLLGGCKKTANTASSSPQSSPPKEEVAKKNKATKAPDKPLAVKEAAKSTPSGTAEKTTPYKRNLPPDETQCMLACNKAQSCGTAEGAVTGCVGACLKALAAKDGELVGVAHAFRAQSQCSKEPCSAFKSCVTAKVLGEKALADAPSLAPSEASKVCKALCEQEQKCHPEEFKQRQGGMGSCRYACRSIFVNPEAEMAPQRALMMTTYKCIKDDCASFEQCVRNSISSR